MKFQRSSDVVKCRTYSRTCPKIRIYISTTPASWKIEFPSADRPCELLVVLISVDVLGSLPLFSASSPCYYCHSSIIRHAPLCKRVTQLGDVLRRPVGRTIDKTKDRRRSRGQPRRLVFVGKQSTEKPDR